MRQSNNYESDEGSQSDKYFAEGLQVIANVDGVEDLRADMQRMGWLQGGPFRPGIITDDETIDPLDMAKIDPDVRQAGEQVMNSISAAAREIALLFEAKDNFIITVNNVRDREAKVIAGLRDIRTPEDI